VFRLLVLQALILTAATTVLSGQAAVQYGAASALSKGAAPAGKAVTGTLDQLDKALGGKAQASESGSKQPAPASTAASKLAPPEPPVTPPNLTALVTGMTRAELIVKAGKPSMSISSVDDSILVETFWYKDGEVTVKVILTGGKVDSISGLEKVAAK